MGFIPETSPSNSRMVKKYKNINRFLIEKALRDFAKGIPDGETVLDIGAGSGHYRDLFEGKRYVAVDRGLEQQSFKGLDVVGDVASLPFKNSAAGYAVCVEVLEHIYEKKAFLKELKRVLRQGGKILLTVPLCVGEHMQPFDFFRYTSFGIKKAVEDEGLKVSMIEPRGGYFTFLAYHLRKFPERCVRSGSLPGLLRKAVIRALNPVFGLIIPFFLLRLDRLDDKRDTTLGYICLIHKD